MFTSLNTMQVNVAFSIAQDVEEPFALCEGNNGVFVPVNDEEWR